MDLTDMKVKMIQTIHAVDRQKSLKRERDQTKPIVLLTEVNGFEFCLDPSW